MAKGELSSSVGLEGFERTREPRVGVAIPQTNAKVFNLLLYLLGRPFLFSVYLAKEFLMCNVEVEVFAQFAKLEIVHGPCERIISEPLNG